MTSSPPKPTAPPDSRRREARSFQARFSAMVSRVLVTLKVEEVPHIKRIVVTVIGGTVLVFGVFLFFTPGTAILVIPVGLAIMGTENAWARRSLRKARLLGRKALSQTQKIISLSDKERENLEAASPATGRARQTSSDVVDA